MKLLEKAIYAVLLFLGVYTLLSITLRVFSWTSVYTSHLIGGLVATIVGVLFFIYLLINKH
jgi:hypothetical protein